MMRYLALFSILWAAGPVRGADRDSTILRDQEEVEATGSWIYNDLKGGFAEARKTGKPLLVLLRCVP